MTDPRSVHKTVLREVTAELAAAVGLASAGVAAAKDIKNSNAGEAATKLLKKAQDANRRGYGSLVKAANNLTLVFPVIVSKTISINTDVLIMKAIERKAVTMLQMVFSAMQVADKNIEDVYGYLAKFHKNLPNSDFSVDDIMQISDAINSMRENGLIPESTKDKMLRQINEAAALKAIAEDLKKNTNFYMESSFNENSISSYRISTSNLGTQVITEAIVGPRGEYGYGVDDKGNVVRRSTVTDYILDPVTGKLILDPINNDSLTPEERKELLKKATEYENRLNIDAGFWKSTQKQLDAEKMDLENSKKIELQKALDNLKKEYEKSRDEEKIDVERRIAMMKAQLDMNAEARKLKNDKELADYKFGKDKELEEIRRKNNWSKDQLAMAKTKFDMLKGHVLDSDIKKANELQPAMMIVNFYINNDKNQLESIKDAVIGVKAKLYPMDSNEIIERIDKKSEEQGLLVMFKKVTTREISFFKDFLFALDKAKIDVVERNKKGSKAKLWQTLESRAKAYKAGKYAGSASAAPITTLVVSHDEVEYLKKFKGIDLESYKTARKIFDGYNFMAICIVDENLEVAKFLFDTGEDNWEVYSFTSLDRESSDSTYKKVVNLMTKIR